jgi:hypothetical protein
MITHPYYSNFRCYLKFSKLEVQIDKFLTTAHHSLGNYQIRRNGELITIPVALAFCICGG